MDYKLIGTIYAPIEYDGPDMLAVFGITKEDLIPYVVGTKRILVYPIEAPEEICRDKLRELRQKYSKRSREDRCLVRGKSGRLIVCPEENKCSACPFGNGERLPQVVSTDALYEAGMELEAPGTDELDRLNWELFLEYLQRMNPQCYEVLGMKLEGATVAEISRELGVPYHVVRYLSDKIRGIAADYFGDEAQPYRKRRK